METKYFNESFKNDAIRKSGLATPETWCKYTNARIQKLHPYIRWHFATAINNIEEKYGIKVRLTDAFRSFDEQNKLYGYSRSVEHLLSKHINASYAKPNSSWRTNAMGGQSYHNFALAGDVCEIKNGKVLYSNANWDAISSEFKKIGFIWMFDQIKKDKPHFQITFNYSTKGLLLLHNQNKYKENGYLIL